MNDDLHKVRLSSVLVQEASHWLPERTVHPPASLVELQRICVRLFIVIKFKRRKKKSPPIQEVGFIQAIQCSEAAHRMGSLTAVRPLEDRSTPPPQVLTWWHHRGGYPTLIPSPTCSLSPLWFTKAPMIRVAGSGARRFSNTPPMMHRLFIIPANKHNTSVRSVCFIRSGLHLKMCHSWLHVTRC